jgi:hypothetical protein
MSAATTVESIRLLSRVSVTNAGWKAAEIPAGHGSSAFSIDAFENHVSKSAGRCPDYNQRVSKNVRHAERGLDERTVAEVFAQAITAVQSQKIPAEVAMKAAMETIGASQKAALDLMLYAAHAQAEVVHELLADDGAKARALVSEVGDLLLGAVERGPEVIGALAAGVAAFLDAAAAPVKPLPQSSPAAGPDSVMEQPAPLTESQLLDAIVQIIADGYSAGSGGAAANTIRERYPAAIPVVQRYLAMDDFLVLMWLRQQPALAQLVADKGFPRYYAEFKAGME